MSEKSSLTFVGIHLGLLVIATVIVLLTQRRGRRYLTGLDADGVAALAGHFPDLAVIRATVLGDIELHPDGTVTRLRDHAGRAPGGGTRESPSPEVDLEPPARDWLLTARIRVTALLGVLTLAGAVFVVLLLASGASVVTGAVVVIPTVAAWLWLHGRVGAAALKELQRQVPTTAQLGPSATDSDFLPIALYGPRAWDDERAAYLLAPTRRGEESTLVED
ncbi:hypothetical protein [Actinokineospora terrae]|uniref:Uncharacterized protein n=1 Tax=Actinokineospora terrae TaxID=155974 RepID=A0A1H9NPP4_9PSEU|nr:hypothetical protein [Actinokineospora terrae]SER37898.1 hypothetical protein SAMN04487818_10368 [Actinokineospora terrae]